MLLALTDMQGRLQGKRLTARHFLDEVAAHGAEACNYLLAVDVEMNTVDGYAMASWARGYGDFVLRARPLDAAPRALARGHRAVPGRRRWDDGAPRRRLAAPGPARASSSAWPSAAGAPTAATELEFLLFRTPYEEAWRRGYRDLDAGQPLQRRLLPDGHRAGRADHPPDPQRDGRRRARVENSKGECNLGQHEINFRYADALTAADEHVIYKTGAKEIAAQEGMAITFMAKFDEREGNSCHIHLSLRARGRLGALRRGPAHLRGLPGRPAGDAARADALARAEHQLLQALRGRLVRPDDGRLGPRQPHVRAARRRPRAGHARRVPRAGRRRQPLPRAQRAHRRAACTASTPGLELEPPLEGNAYVADKPRVPGTLRDARDRSPRSAVAREAFGEEVVEHYLNNARVELEAFDAAVTDWERVRGFERL